MKQQNAVVLHRPHSKDGVEEVTDFPPLKKAGNITYLICLSADSLPACADETAVAGISEAALTPRRAKADVCSAEEEEAAWDSLATEVDRADPS